MTNDGAGDDDPVAETRAKRAGLFRGDFQAIAGRRNRSNQSNPSAELVCAPSRLRREG